MHHLWGFLHSLLVFLLSSEVAARDPEACQSSGYLSVAQQADIREPHIDDYLKGLSGSQKRYILTMRPTWSERWRMSEPCPAEQKNRILVGIIAERRALYDRWFQEQCMLAALARAEDFYSWKDRKSDLEGKQAYAHQATINLMTGYRLKQDNRERRQFMDRQSAVPARQSLQNRMRAHEGRVDGPEPDNDEDRER